MKIFFICVLSVFVLSVTSVYAGPGHSHSHSKPINKEQAIKNATKIVSSIVKKGKVDGSWENVKNAKATTKKNKYGKEWVVTFKNPKIEDQAKKTLYVFLSIDGKYLGANFSGK